MTEWQPIETAPKDGRILGWNGFEVESLEKFDDVWGQVSDSGRITASRPTHWMPLPKPPKDAE